MRSLSALALTAALALPSAAFAAPTSWILDTAHTEVGFRVKHMKVTNVSGRFKDFKGSVAFDENDLSQDLSIDVEIQVASIFTDQAKRDDHLRSADFFDVEKHPTLKFVSTKGKAKKIAPGHFQVPGQLTIRGVTKPLTLDVKGFEETVVDPWGNKLRGGTATAVLHRKDFGLTWNKKLEAGGFLVSDEVTILLEVELQPAPVAAPQKS
jgi:polyisoprenoid-binding protein YceI